jgi:uncharacterized protein (TIGR03083 family)
MMISAERASFVEALSALPEEAWSRPTLCEGWTVKDAVGHMASTGFMTPGRFFGKLIGAGFSFNRMGAKEISAQTAGKTPDELVAVLRSQVDRRNGPPGPPMAMLGEAIIHGEDIFRAQGAYREHNVDNVVAVADFYKKSNLIVGAKKRIDGLHLKATDAAWEHNAGYGSGQGHEVSGPILALVLAMTGRKAILEDLSGSGVDTLRQRP